jgi:phage shock protein E
MKVWLSDICRTILRGFTISTPYKISNKPDRFKCPAAFPKSLLICWPNQAVMKRLLQSLLLLLFSGAAAAQGKSTLPPAEYEKAIQAKGAQLLDVRRPEEYKEGHIKGATLANWQQEDQFKAQAVKLDKSKPVYVYCLSGVRSGRAANWLTQNGFTNVVNLEGGIEAWKNAGKPVER